MILKKYLSATNNSIAKTKKFHCMKSHDFLIVHTGTDDLTNTTNLLNNVRKTHKKVKQVSLEMRIAFLNIIDEKDKQQNIDKSRMDTNGRLKNFFKQKDMDHINNGNLSEDHSGVKTLDLNKRGNSIFTKKLLAYIEQ